MEEQGRGRVHRSREEWRAILKRYAETGVATESFCEREGITRSNLTRWRSRFGERRRGNTRYSLKIA